MKQKYAHQRIICLIIVAIIVAAVLLTVFFTCTNTGRLICNMGPSYQIVWSFQPKGYGHTLFVCRVKDDTTVFALRDISNQDAKAVVCTVKDNTELQMMRSYVENGNPKTEFLYLFLVAGYDFERNDVSHFDYKGLTQFTIQPIEDLLVVLCITETDKYNSDELRQIGINAYCE